LFKCNLHRYNEAEEEEGQDEDDEEEVAEKMKKKRERRRGRLSAYAPRGAAGEVFTISGLSGSFDTAEVRNAVVGLALFATSFCSQNTVQLMTARWSM
jgi:hypothetical protein